MSDLILINILGGFKDFSIGLFVISLFIVWLTFCPFIEDYDEKKDKTKKRIRRIFTVIAVIFLLFATILPTKKELYLIYGFGSVIDYVDNNETAKELPDKVIDIVDSYLTKQDSILKLK